MANSTNNRDIEIVAKIKAIKTAIRSLLREAENHAEAVAIDPENGIDFYKNVARFEASLIESALETTGGRQNQAAKLLNLQKSTLSWKIKKLRIKSR